jgi:hypothetical protein
MLGSGEIDNLLQCSPLRVRFNSADQQIYLSPSIVSVSAGDDCATLTAYVFLISRNPVE